MQHGPSHRSQHQDKHLTNTQGMMCGRLSYGDIMRTAPRTSPLSVDCDRVMRLMDDLEAEVGCLTAAALGGSGSPQKGGSGSAPRARSAAPAGRGGRAAGASSFTPSPCAGQLDVFWGRRAALHVALASCVELNRLSLAAHKSCSCRSLLFMDTKPPVAYAQAAMMTGHLASCTAELASCCMA